MIHEIPVSETWVTLITFYMKSRIYIPLTSNVES